ncbi:hypothetical protein [Variovorax sp. JS1663]|uniref:hypothetical protein n=1 Tax=Variovorax sp. JS1663 TaxID=1851577 RepID=UPI00117F7EDB|nr:hypothetical protein [Variovorax sp. JS1663]
MAAFATAESRGDGSVDLQEREKIKTCTNKKLKMTELILFILADILLCGTGMLILWLASFGRFKLGIPTRTASSYWVFSLVGLLAWATILFFALINLGG